jgi:hypothetical protein
MPAQRCILVLAVDGAPVLCFKHAWLPPPSSAASAAAAAPQRRRIAHHFYMQLRRPRHSRAASAAAPRQRRGRFAPMSALMTHGGSFDPAHMPALPEGQEWAHVYAVNDYGIKPDSDADPQVRPGSSTSMWQPLSLAVAARRAQLLGGARPVLG